MPLYATRCSSCGQAADLRLTFSDYDAVHLGTKVLTCAACQGPVALQFEPGQVQFVLKDGESGGWVSKAGRENKYRRARGEVMAQRQRDHVTKRSLQPNFAGEETGSWEAAKSLAYDTAYREVKGETGDSALAMSAASEASKTYDPLVKKSGLCSAFCRVSVVVRATWTS